MIITDGEPRGPGDAGEETARAFAEAEALRDKQVLIIGVAIGPDRNKFKNNIVRMTGSEENTFNATTDGLETILDKLVEASCNNGTEMNNHTFFLFSPTPCCFKFCIILS